MNSRMDDAAKQKFRQEEEQSMKEGRQIKEEEVQVGLEKGPIQQPINQISAEKGNKDTIKLMRDVAIILQEKQAQEAYFDQLQPSRARRIMKLIQFYKLFVVLKVQITNIIYFQHLKYLMKYFNLQIFIILLFSFYLNFQKYESFFFNHNDKFVIDSINPKEYKKYLNYIQK